MFGHNDKVRELEALQRVARKESVVAGIEKNALKKGMKIFVSYNLIDGNGCYPNQIHTIKAVSPTHIQTEVKSTYSFKDEPSIVNIPLNEHEFYSAEELLAQRSKTHD